MEGIIFAAAAVLIIAVGVALFCSGTKKYINTEKRFVLINAKNPDTIEQTVRRAVKAYPDRDIYVLNHSPDSAQILSILQREMPRLFVINDIKKDNA